MKKAQTIDIQEYPANIEVFASRDDDDGTWGGRGRILTISCDGDAIPSASYVPTIRVLYDQAEGYLTLGQCRKIKERIVDHCRQWWN